MLTDDIMVKVTNRFDGSTGYKIPDLGVMHRQFQAGESKEISMKELRALAYVPGGQWILDNCLVINNEEAVQEIVGHVEPEYYYDETNVDELLLHGSLDSLLDCLDFAPNGVIEIIKTRAVALELNDIKKREAILDKTGFNVTNAISIIKASQEDEEPVEESKTRRVAVPSTQEEGAPARRTATPKYKL